MDLATVLSQNPMVGVLDAEDFESLFGLFEKSPMKAQGLQLVYDRRPDFNSLLECQAQNYRTFVIRKDRGVSSLGSISWGPRWVSAVSAKEPQRVNVSYAGDFRAIFDRQTALAWRQFYSDLLDAVFSSHEFGPSQYLLTAVLDGNELARRNIIETKRRRVRFIYDFLKKIKMVNFFLHKPWKHKRSPEGWRVRSPEISEERVWRQWLSEQHQQMFFGYDYSEQVGNEWDRRKQSWPGWSFSDFLAVYDEFGELVMMTLPWAPTAVKRMRVASGTLSSTILYKLFRSVGFNSPVVGQPFETLYLTHVSFSKKHSHVQKQKALLALFSYLEAQGVFRRFNMVSFADQAQLVDAELFSAYFIQKMAVNLYAVRRPQDPAVIFNPEAEIDFEMALV